MSYKLEDLPYQRQAIDAVIRLFDGQQRHYFDLQLPGDCYPNRLDLTRQEIVGNVEKIAAENGISHGEANVCIDPDYCIEMETGTGKTLVYLRTIYELCQEYGFAKLIILVPSVPIREGVLDTIGSFRPQFERLYNRACPKIRDSGSNHFWLFIRPAQSRVIFQRPSRFMQSPQIRPAHP